MLAVSGKAKRLVIAGCGSRGRGYARFAEEYPERAQIVAIAEPRDYYRDLIGDRYGVPAERRYRCWTELAAQPCLGDAALVCTQDDMHEEPAIAFMQKGYHLLLEKPMAPTEAACRNIVAAARESGVIFAVCHVLRYTVLTRKVKELIQAGAIGDIVSLQRLEGVGHWHQAHSFVRGNWRNEKESSFMLLAKSCHDVDWIRYVMNERCLRVQSFGSLHLFRRENQPAGAADRCTECPAAVESQCPYSALKIYIRDRVRQGRTHWPVDVLTADVSEAGVMKALREGPYGRCVYACDNDVVDNQVVNFEFTGRRTASLTMTAFQENGRKTRIFGTRGTLEISGDTIVLDDFLTGKKTTFDTKTMNDNSILSGHGGGDAGLMESFMRALETGDASCVLSGAEETLESHLMVFAAERSRREQTVEEIKD
ncbi:MAG: Gfo/Idh/MocA family oxidoreductase [Lentisphaerae bacterium]|jgi:predicted dehydrogenase|nr:Gfo/Idh/MocA family oxidoreductase [Lentisphaerota bacterium]